MSEAITWQLNAAEAELCQLHLSPFDEHVSKKSPNLVVLVHVVVCTHLKGCLLLHADDMGDVHMSLPRLEQYACAAERLFSQNRRNPADDRPFDLLSSRVLQSIVIDGMDVQWISEPSLDSEASSSAQRTLRPFLLIVASTLVIITKGCPWLCLDLPGDSLCSVYLLYWGCKHAL
jgi:hypothetical protein